MIKHETADIFLDDNGFVWFKFRQDAEITLDHAHEYVPIMEQVCAGEKRCFILDTRGTNATVTRENRKFMGDNPEALKWRKADAMLLDSLGVRLLANFYMKVDTPQHPVKLFAEEEAVKWLLQF